MCRMNFAVVSRVVEMSPVLIPAEGDGPRLAKRHALGIARKQGIPKPVAVPEREAALRIRRMAAAMQRQMPDLNGHGVPFWQIPVRTPLYAGQ